MDIISKINSILNLQEENNRIMPVDLVLKNGNLQVRAFQIVKFDQVGGVIEGLTRLEVYSSLREKRDAVIGKFSLTEIRDLFCEEIDYVMA